MTKEKLKEIIKDAIKVLAFVLIFFLILESVSVMFFSNKAATGFANQLRDAYSFVEEPENTIQIAGVGDSNLYSGYSPLEMWNLYGHTSTVCASPRQSIKNSEVLMRQLFEVQKPKLVIIETDMLYEDDPENVTVAKKSRKLDDFFKRVEPEFFEDDVGYVFTVFQFHNKWKYGKEQKDPDEIHTHGYKYNTKIVKLKEYEYMKKTDKREPIDEKSKEQFNSLVNFCHSQGAEVMLVEMPSITSWNYERHNATMDYAKELKVPFVDLNLKYKETGIDKLSDFRDNGNHLNYDGAKKASKYICDFIENNYKFENLKTNKKYNYWNDDYEKFIKHHQEAIKNK